MTHRIRGVVSLVLTAVFAGGAAAQIGLPRYRTTPEDRQVTFKIKRRNVSGTIKSLNGDRKLLVLAQGDKEVPVDVGPAIIRAGDGMATFNDLKVGDKLSVYGETTVQGGIRAMEIKAPRERKSIEPKRNQKLTPEEKAKIKEAEEFRKAEEKRRREEEKAAEKLRKEEERKKREEEKRAREEERRREREKKDSG